VWLGCSIGLFAADIIGMLIGYLLKSKTPDNFLNTLAFIIFAIFGVYTLRQGLLLESSPLPQSAATPVLVVVTILFVATCVFYYRKQRRAAAS
jgi:putative Mn2+ efflux pump MntP